MYYTRLDIGWAIPISWHLSKILCTNNLNIPDFLHNTDNLQHLRFPLGIHVTPAMPAWYQHPGRCTMFLLGTLPTSSLAIDPAGRVGRPFGTRGSWVAPTWLTLHLWQSPFLAFSWCASFLHVVASGILLIRGLIDQEPKSSGVTWYVEKKPN